MNGIADFPADWGQMTLRDLHAGGICSLDPRNYPDESFEYYSIPAYQEAAKPLVVPGSDIQSQKLLITDSCLLFGKLNPRVEKVWNVKSTVTLRRLASTEWLPIVPIEKLNQDFGYYLLRSEWVMPIAKGLVSGSTPSRERVEPKSFYDITVPLPPYPEQRSIAGLLSLLDRSIHKQSELLGELATLKRTAMRELFTRGLRGEPQKDTEIGPVPDSWGVIPVSQLAIVRGGKRMPKGVSLVRENTGRPYIRVTDFKDHSVREEGILFVPVGYEGFIERYRISSRDVYISIAGKIGLVGQVPKTLDDANLTENAAKLVFERDDVLPRHVMYALADEVCQDQISRATAKNAQPKLALTRLENIRVPTPPSINEQREIVTILDALDRKIDLHRQKRAVLEELFKSLLHKLMTGAIRVDELDLSALADIPGREEAAAT